MFSLNELLVDSTYFDVLGASCFCITLCSKSTGHYWHIENADGLHYRSCRIYHRHSSKGAYHLHGHGATIEECIQKIKSHDVYQLNGRKK